MLYLFKEFNGNWSTWHGNVVVASNTCAMPLEVDKIKKIEKLEQLGLPAVLGMLDKVDDGLQDLLFGGSHVGIIAVE